MPMTEDELILKWDAVIDEATYYEILGLLEIADDGAIKDAYRRFAQAFHPDAHPDADAVMARTLRRIFQRGVEAYRTLSDHELRADYDMELSRGGLRLQDSKRPPTKPGGAKSLEDLCRSMSAKLSARKADRSIVRGQLTEAKEQLQMALHHDNGDNPELAERLDALDLVLFARGQ